MDLNKNRLFTQVIQKNKEKEKLRKNREEEEKHIKREEARASKAECEDQMRYLINVRDLINNEIRRVEFTHADLCYQLQADVFKHEPIIGKPYPDFELLMSKNHLIKAKIKKPSQKIRMYLLQLSSTLNQKTKRTAKRFHVVAEQSCEK